ncbi:MAG: hypothetical protein HYY24_21740 [Verrucomicrobia bacterium]|nr:hypothetical protein [Verrucomicrobiota bacterium]
MRMHPVWTKRISVEWLKKPVYLLYALAGIYLGYLVSLGPMLRCCGAKGSGGLTSLPSWLRAFYGPTDVLVPAKFDNYYATYLEWWVVSEK